MSRQVLFREGWCGEVSSLDPPTDQASKASNVLGLDFGPGHRDVQEIAAEATSRGEALRDFQALEKALSSLRAARIRTGAPLARRELHRSIERFRLKPLDAAELEARADDEDLLQAIDGDRFDEGTAQAEEFDVVRAMLDATRLQRMCTPKEHRELARVISNSKRAKEELMLNKALDEDERASLEQTLSG